MLVVYHALLALLVNASATLVINSAAVIRAWLFRIGYVHTNVSARDTFIMRIMRGFVFGVDDVVGLFL